MKKTGLSTVLNAAAKGEPPVEPRRTSDPPRNPRTSERSYREGRHLVAGYFHPSTKASLRQIQVTHLDKTVQDLLEEALNDLFAKYNVPQSAALASNRGRRASNAP
jgi:hypothetical protein